MRNPVKDFMFSVAALATAAILVYSDAGSAAGIAGSSGTVTVHSAGTTSNAVIADSAAMLSPSTTMWATRGLIQTASAEPMGEGKLMVSGVCTWYSQGRSFPFAASNGDNIMTGNAAVSYGINPYLDIFTALAGYGWFSDSTDIGIGSFTAGIQGALPTIPEILPLHLGAQLAIIGGTSSNQIDPYFFDGYDFYETRVETELMGKIIETFTFGNDSRGIKLHFNEGTSMLLRNWRRKMLLLNGGIEGAVNPRVVIGLEMSSRTDSYNMYVRTDPLWLTPSIMYRTPYSFNALAGVDISLSKDRTWTPVRALEPFRIFIGITSSFDLLAGKRRAKREKMLREKAEIERKFREIQARNEYLARKVRADSIALANARVADALKSDSMAQSARQDSIALAETKIKLAEELSKRSDAEKQLLSTGLLLLDAVYFETGKAQISINSFPYLNIIGKMLAKYPKLQIEVSGHTDNIGKYDNNMTLSQSRAEAVRRYLIQVSPDLLTRISARGYGSTQPKAPNTTADGRKMNRRVELQVLNKEVLKEYN